MDATLSDASDYDQKRDPKQAQAALTLIQKNI
jgi:hypothetical protein